MRKIDNLENNVNFFEVVRIGKLPILCLREGYADENYYYYHADLWYAVHPENGIAVESAHSIEELLHNLYSEGLHEAVQADLYSENYIEHCQQFDRLVNEFLLLENFGYEVYNGS